MASKSRTFKLNMKDGSTKEVTGTPIGVDFFYHKEDGRYWLTHIKSGKLVTSARTVKLLRELANEPEFFGDLTVRGLYKAYIRWADRNNWKI